MLASRERRQIAARIGALTRCRPDDPELPELRRRLDAQRVADIARWAEAARSGLQAGTAEVGNAAIQVAQADREMGHAGDAAA